MDNPKQEEQKAKPDPFAKYLPRSKRSPVYCTQCVFCGVAQDHDGNEFHACNHPELAKSAIRPDSGESEARCVEFNLIGNCGSYHPAMTRAEIMEALVNYFKMEKKKGEPQVTSE